MERLQDGDRFYYLSRTQGLNLLNQLEADSFAELLRRNTDTEETGLHVNGAAFQTAAYILEMDQSKQYNAGLGNADPVSTDPILGGIQAGGPSLVKRGPGSIEYLGGEHVVLGGTNGNDKITGGLGDDTLWGEGGNDDLEGGFGVDHIFGGDGDDVITDKGSDIGEFDIIHGDAGNDVINAGQGLDLIFGGTGQDFIFGGSEDKDITAGEGNDFVRGGSGLGFIKGNEGDDWLEGGDSFDTLAGENSELFFNSTIIGHDVLNGRGNDNDYDAESGDDIMFQGPGIQRNNGMAGFDWAIHKGDAVGADSDMNVSIFVNQQNNILRDRFDLVEGLSGWQNNDKLTGRNVVVGAFDVGGNAAQVDPTAPLDSYSNALLEKNLGLIKGLAELVAHLQRTSVTVAGKTETIVMDTSTASDILLGGGGSDLIRGMAGNDIIDGDRWLNVRIAFNHQGVEYTTDGLGEPVWRLTDYVAGAPLAGAVPAFAGQTLDKLMFSRAVNPGALNIVREIVDGGRQGDVDTAVYADARANYTITANPDGSFTVEHVTVTPGIDPATGRNRDNEGIDRLTNIERIQFADETVSLGRPTIDLHAFDPANLRDEFAAASYAGTNGSVAWTSAWTETNDRTALPNGGAVTAVTTGEIRVNAGALEFRQDPNGTAGNAPGATLTRTVNLSPAVGNAATLSFSFVEANLEAAETLQVQFAADGVNFTTLQTLNGNSGTGTASLALTGPFSANSAVRFVFSGVSAGNETIRIDDVNIVYPVRVEDQTNNWAATFTEDGPGVAISRDPKSRRDLGRALHPRVSRSRTRWRGIRSRLRISRPV